MSNSPPPNPTLTVSPPSRRAFRVVEVGPLLTLARAIPEEDKVALLASALKASAAELAAAKKELETARADLVQYGQHWATGEQRGGRRGAEL